MQYVLDALKRFACWLIAMFLSTVGELFLMLLELLPELPGVDWVAVGTWFGWANHWFPVTEALTLLLAYLVLWVTMIVVRWVLGLTPTIG